MIRGPRRRSASIAAAVAALTVGAVLMYGAWPIAGIIAVFGSSAIALAVLAHLGVLAALVGPMVVFRRRRRDRSLSAHQVSSVSQSGATD